VTWYADHAPCTYFGEDCAPNLKAIGWLAADQPYRTGDLPPIVTSNLVRLLKNAYQPVFFLGGHTCELCPENGVSGYLNLFVPAKGFLYVCPELILHYISAHQYRPPNEFCNAVLRCPRPSGWLYKRRFQRNGGKCFGPVYETYDPRFDARKILTRLLKILLGVTL
jgi:hypothetical protein